MRYWKVCAPVHDDVDEPAAWMLQFEPTYRDAAIAFAKDWVRRIEHTDALEVIVVPEAGGVARTFNVRVTAMLTFSADEVAHAQA